MRIDASYFPRKFDGETTEEGEEFPYGGFGSCRSYICCRNNWFWRGESQSHVAAEEMARIQTSGQRPASGWAQAGSMRPATKMGDLDFQVSRFFISRRIARSILGNREFFFAGVHLGFQSGDDGRMHLGYARFGQIQRGADFLHGHFFVVIQHNNKTLGTAEAFC